MSTVPTSNTDIPAGVQASSGSSAGAGAGAESGAAPSVPSTTSDSATTSATSGTGSSSGNKDSSSSASGTGPIPGSAQVDPEVPRTSKEAPIFGVEAAKDVPFAQQVQGHAKYFAGKIFGNDKEVQQGAARARGEEATLPADAQKESGDASKSGSQ